MSFLRKLWDQLVGEWWAFKRTVRRVRAYPSRVRNSYQRARRGYGERDTFDLHHYLAPVIAGGAQRLRRRAIGHPGTITMREWDDILLEIEQGFTKYSRTDEWDDEEVKRAMALFAEWFPHLWD